MKLTNKDQFSTESLRPILRTGRRYAVITGIVIFGALYAYILFLSNSLSQKEPREADVTQQVQTTVRPKIDPNVAETMTNLEDQNLDIKAIFDEARENPFTE